MRLDASGGLQVVAAGADKAQDRMDIDAGVILGSTPVEVVGRQIFEEILAVASGKQTKSERSGVGEEEFAPWQIGPTL